LGDDGRGSVYILIGQIYEEGANGIEQDHKNALDFYIKADAENCEDGSLMTGTYYLNCIGGVEQSFKKAFEYYSKAAANNSGFGQLFLGKMYFEGTYVKQGFNRLLQLFQESYKNDCEKAKTFIYKIFVSRLMAEMQIRMTEKKS
jgi:TPR repeat protein